MTPSVVAFDQWEDSFEVRSRRETSCTRPPKRESARFAKRRGKQGTFNGGHRRCQKQFGL